MDNLLFFNALVENNTIDEKWPTQVQERFKIAKVLHGTFIEACMNGGKFDVLKNLLKIHAVVTNHKPGLAGSVAMADFILATEEKENEHKYKKVFLRLEILTVVLVQEFFTAVLNSGCKLEASFVEKGEVTSLKSNAVSGTNTNAYSSKLDDLFKKK